MHLTSRKGSVSCKWVWGCVSSKEEEGLWEIWQCLTISIPFMTLFHNRSFVPSSTLFSVERRLCFASLGSKKCLISLGSNSRSLGPLGQQSALWSFLLWLTFQGYDVAMMLMKMKIAKLDGGANQIKTVNWDQTRVMTGLQMMTLMKMVMR